MQPEDQAWVLPSLRVCVCTCIYCIGKIWTKHPGLQGRAPCNALPMNARERPSAQEKAKQPGIPAACCTRLSGPLHRTYIFTLQHYINFILGLWVFWYGRTKHPGLQGRTPCNAIPKRYCVAYGVERAEASQAMPGSAGDCHRRGKGT